jgi:tetratricopeptide (TPR) repeat protein
VTDRVNSAVAIQRALALLAVGRNDEAASALRDLLARDPNHTMALVLLSQALRDVHPDESLELARKATGVEPNAGWVHINAAWAADATRDRRAAISSARTAVALNPHDAAGYQALAQLLAKANQMLPDAVSAANKAAELSPHDPVTWIALGNVARADKNLSEARRFYEHALELQPDHRVAQLNLAAVRHIDGAIGSSMDLLQSIIQLNPRDETARLRLDALVQSFLHEMLWLSLAVGFALAFIIRLITGAE